MLGGSEDSTMINKLSKTTINSASKRKSLHDIISCNKDYNEEKDTLKECDLSFDVIADDVEMIVNDFVGCVGYIYPEGYVTDHGDLEHLVEKVETIVNPDECIPAKPEIEQEHIPIKPDIVEDHGIIEHDIVQESIPFDHKAEQESIHAPITIDYMKIIQEMDEEKRKKESEMCEEQIKKWKLKKECVLDAPKRTRGRPKHSGAEKPLIKQMKQIQVQIGDDFMLCNNDESEDIGSSSSRKLKKEPVFDSPKRPRGRPKKSEAEKLLNTQKKQIQVQTGNNVMPCDAEIACSSSSRKLKKVPVLDVPKRRRGRPKKSEVEQPSNKQKKQIQVQIDDDVMLCDVGEAEDVSSSIGDSVMSDVDEVRVVVREEEEMEMDEDGEFEPKVKVEKLDISDYLEPECFECKMCDESFHNALQMRSHVRSEHLGIPLETEIPLHAPDTFDNAEHEVEEGREQNVKPKKRRKSKVVEEDRKQGKKKKIEKKQVKQQKKIRVTIRVKSDSEMLERKDDITIDNRKVKEENAQIATKEQKKPGYKRVSLPPFIVPDECDKANPIFNDTGMATAFICKLCRRTLKVNKAAGYKVVYSEHIKTHFKHKEFSCPLCDHGFHREREMRKHIAKKHSDDVDAEEMVPRKRPIRHRFEELDDSVNSQSELDKTMNEDEELIGMQLPFHTDYYEEPITMMGIQQTEKRKGCEQIADNKHTENEDTEDNEQVENEEIEENNHVENEEIENNEQVENEEIEDNKHVENEEIEDNMYVENQGIDYKLVESEEIKDDKQVENEEVNNNKQVDNEEIANNKQVEGQGQHSEYKKSNEEKIEILDAIIKSGEPDRKECMLVHPGLVAVEVSLDEQVFTKDPTQSEEGTIVYRLEEEDQCTESTFLAASIPLTESVLQAEGERNSPSVLEVLNLTSKSGKS